MPTKEEIVQSFVEAGWELDDGFREHLAIGKSHHLSILATRRAWKSEDPAFELCDGDKGTTYWVKEIPTPERAAKLLEEHGRPIEEEQG